MKSSHEIEFEQRLKSIDIEFQIFENPKSTAKLTQNKINQINAMIKQLSKVYERVQQKMKANMRNKNYDEYDIKSKLKRYQQGLQKSKQRFRKLQDKIVQVEKSELMKNRTLNSTQVNDYQRLNDHLDRVNNIHKQAQQTADIYQGIVQQTGRQIDTLDNIKKDADQFEHELGMSEQLMRVIANRQLVTKLMLVLLVFFLGLADILILLVKLL